MKIDESFGGDFRAWEMSFRSVVAVWVPTRKSRRKENFVFIRHTVAMEKQQMNEKEKIEL